MAVSTEEMQLILRAQNQVSAVLRQIQQDMGRLGTSTASPQRAFSSLFDTIKAGIGIAGGFAVFNTAASALRSAAGSAIDFERTMSGVKAVSGATGEQFKQLTNLALQLGKDTAFSASQAAAGIEELVKGGVSLADIMGGAAAASLNLAAAGGVSLAEASEIAANAMSQFGLTGADMAKVADNVAGAANASSLSVGDFRQSLAQIGAVAHGAGQTFEETATAIAVMGAAGIKGSDAGTSLKTMLLSLQPATDKASAAFRELGIITADGANRFFDAQGRVKDLSQIAGVLQDATRGLTEQQKLQRLETIFGSDAMRAALIVAEAGERGFRNMAGAMSKVTAEAVALQRLDNVAGDIEQLRGSAETLGIVLLSTLAPGFRTVLQRATEFVNRFTQEAQTVIQTAQNIAGAHGIRGIDAAFIAVENRVGEVFGSTWQGRFHSAGQAVRDGLGIVREAVAWIGQHEDAVRALAGAYLALAGAQGLGAAIKAITEFRAALLLTNPLLLGGTVAVAGFGAAMATNFSGSRDRVLVFLDELRRMPATFVEVFQENTSAIRQWWTIANRNLTEFLAVANAVGAGVSESIGGMAAAVGNALDVVGAATEGAIAELSRFGDWLIGLAGIVAGPALAAGEAIWQGLVRGISSGLAAVRNAAVSMAQNALAAARAALESHSPSLQFEELGQDAVEGFEQGLDDNQDAIQAAREMAEDAIAAVEEILRDAPRSLGQLAGDLAAAIGATVERALTPAEQAQQEYEQKREDAKRKHLQRLADLEEDLGGKQGKAREAVQERIREQEEQFGADMARLVQERGDRVIDLERQQAEKRGRAIRAFVDDFDDLTRDVERRSAEIGEATGRAINEAIIEAGRGIQEAKDAAARNIRDLENALTASRRLRTEREGFATVQSGAALKRQRDLEDAALLERNRQELEDFDRQFAADSLETIRRERQRRQEVADLEFELEKDLQDAKTDEERDGIKKRFDQTMADLRRRREIEDRERETRRHEDRAVIEARLRSEQDALARRRLAEQDDANFRRQQAEALQAFNDAIEDQGLRDAIKRVEAERDSRIDAINAALAEKEKALRENESKERAALVESYRQRVEDLRKHLLGEIGPLLGEGQGLLDTFLNAIMTRAAEAMKLAGTASGGASSGGSSAPSGQALRPGGKPGETAAEVLNYYRNTGQEPPKEVVIGALNQAVATGSPPPTNKELQNAGVLKPGEKLLNFGGGGDVPGPTGAARLAVVHGGERVLTPEQQRVGVAGPTTYVFELDGAEIGRATAPSVQSEQNRLVRLRVV